MMVMSMPGIVRVVVRMDMRVSVSIVIVRVAVGLRHGGFASLVLEMRSQ
jgi:hypothetical protein